ncbi:hypothetical protein GQ55_8G257100 [Panicum hallii var. hallii]|uniref:Uncharacterized protein n=1 Tax=Panicum hallii var. hallii TaxID=1504633 RepID=A0A2T7CR88_9POAL|nr:hypothetical protein GQ55_8G257100 [Panicum hallii var. hallii]
MQFLLIWNCQIEYTSNSKEIKEYALATTRYLPRQLSCTRGTKQLIVISKIQTRRWTQQTCGRRCRSTYSSRSSAALGATAVVRCAGVCRPWRRAVIGNASCRRPRPDHFNPNLLIGFFYRYLLIAGMQYVPGPFENVLAMDFADTPWYKRDKHSNPHYTSIGFFEPRRVALVARRVPTPRRKRERGDEPLPVQPPGQDLRVHPRRRDDYCPSTRGGDAGDHSAVVFWILAVKREHDVERGVVYQIFSAASGEWGRVVKRSARFEEGLTHASMCVFAVDVRTERTWRMELPEEYLVLASGTCYYYYRLVLETSGDGRLSFILQRGHHQIEVWVLVGDGERTMRRAIDLYGFFPREGRVWFMIRGFCPRSGCLFGDVDHQKELLIDVDRGSLRPTGRIDIGSVTRYPYEMDWSTYLSKMKYF